MTRNSPKPRPAITLLEVLIVMALAGILLGMLSASIQRTREAASRIACQAHLKDLTLAVHNYDTVNGKMPPYASGRPGEIYGGWFMHLLPYLDQEHLYQEIVAKQRTVHRNMHIATTGMFLPAAKEAVFAELVCASDPTRHGDTGNNLTNYLANWYALSNGVRSPYQRGQRFEALANGLSNVILFAEGYSDCSGVERFALYSARYHNFGITQDGLPSDAAAYAPYDYLMFQVNPRECDHWRAQTAHSAMPIAAVDGSVRLVAPTISAQAWKHLVKPNERAIAHEGNW